jgi:hypothetical protein
MHSKLLAIVWADMLDMYSHLRLHIKLALILGRNQSLELSENKSSFVVVVGVEICYNIVCPCVGTL